MELSVVAALRHDPGHGLGHSVDGAVIGAPGGQIGIEAVAHHGDGIGGAAQNREAGSHGLCGGQLIAAAVGHGDCRGADTGVKHLDKSLLGADVEVGDRCLNRLCKRRIFALQNLFHLLGRDLFEIVVLLGGHQDPDVGLLVGTVGIEEGTGNIHDRPAPPLEDKPGLFGDAGQRSRLQVLLGGVFEKFRLIFGRHDNSHALLGFGDGQFSAVKSFIFLGNEVQIDLQAVCQLADGDGDTARAEVIALFDEAGDLGTAEQSLELALCGGIALLNFRAAGGQRLLGVGLGGTCGAADAVTSGAAAQQDDDIAGVGVETLHVGACRRAHDRADLHAFGQIAGVVDLGDMTGGKTDLVAVAGIAVRSADDQLFLGKLAPDGLGNGNSGIRRTGHAHGLIDIAASRQRIADGTAQAGCRAAERLDLCGMVVGLIFKEDKPLLGLGPVAVIDLDRNHDGAGVVFIGLFHIGELAVRLELLHAHDGQVHQTDRLVGAACIELAPGIGIALPGGLDGGAVETVLELDIFEFCGESGVSAVVRPVGIQHADLGDGGIAVLGIAEIGLNELEIRPGHGKTQGGIQFFQRAVIHGGKSVEDLHIIRFGIFGLQGGGLFHSRFAGIHGVDAVGLDAVKVLSGQVTLKQIGDRRAHHRFLLFIEKLQALLSAVCALVKLTGKGLYGKQAGPFGDLNIFFI